jgi:uncharacterized protein
MASFDPIAALLGGGLIGLASVLLMMLTGRIAGISGILGGCLTLPAGDWLWRAAFIAGLVLAPVASGLLGFSLPAPRMPASWVVIVIAGLLVGFGARLGGGCTSGHGICGLASLQIPSLLAVVTFLATAMVTVRVVAHFSSVLP